MSQRRHHVKKSPGKTPSPQQPQVERGARASAGLRVAALVILLAVAALRMLLTESLSPTWAGAGRWLDETALRMLLAGPTPATSMALTGWILLAGLLWLAAQALAPRPVAARWALPFIGLFLVGAVVSFIAADNQAAARNHSLQVLGLLISFWLLVQLLATPLLRRLAMLTLLAVGLLFTFQALYQHYYENPWFVGQQWPQIKAEHFARQGWNENDPQARQYAERVLSAEVKGFAINANAAAALLLIVALATAGWAMQKFRARPAPMRTLFAGVTAALAGVVLGTVWLTRSRGGLAAAVFALLLLALLALARNYLARRWRLATIATAVLVLTGLVGVTLFAVRFRQPGPDSVWYRNGAAQSLLVRWHYWTAAGEMVRDHPVTGVGGGNFGQTYLQYKRPEALEDVDNPHNFALAALTQFGLFGGVGFVGLIVWMLVALARPAGPEETPSTSRTREVRWLLIAAGGMALLGLIRALIQWPNYGELVSNVVMILLGPVLLLVLAISRDRFSMSLAIGERDAAVGTACGLAGFLLASFIDFGMSQAGPASAFWSLGAIAMASRRSPPKTVAATPAMRSKWAAAAALAIVLVIVFLVRAQLPVARSQSLMQRVAAGQQPVSTTNFGVELTLYPPTFLDAALAADPLEAEVPYFMAERLWDRLAASPTPTEQSLRQVIELYDVARRRNPGWFAPLLRAGQARLQLARSPGEVNQALELIRQAVQLRPTSVSVWTQYGAALRQAGRPAEAADALAEALRLNAVTDSYDAPKNLFALSPTQRDQLISAYQSARDAASAQTRPAGEGG